MKELDEAIAAIDRQMDALAADRAALVRAKNIVSKRMVRQLELEQTGATTDIGFGPIPGLDSITQYAQAILRQSGKPMHVDAILAQIEALGKKTTKQSVVSALIRDKKRFENIGRNTFRLKEQPKDESSMQKTA
jgi:HB1, ASXL, restriction endonuclease HTH domain